MSTLTLNITIPNSPGHLQPGEHNGLFTSNNANSSLGRRPVDQQTITQMTQLLGALLKPLLSSSGGDSSLNGNGINPLSRLANTSGLNGNAGVHLPPDVDGAQGHVGNSSPQNNSQSTLNDMTRNGLDQSLQPDGLGGATISDNPLLKALVKLIAQMMDGLHNQYGHPEEANHATSGSGHDLVDDSARRRSGGTSPQDVSSYSTKPLTTEPDGSTLVPGDKTMGTGLHTPVSDHADPSGSAGTGASQAVKFPTASATPNVLHDTIVIKAGQVFDGKGQTFTAGKELGDGSQSETQKPLFKLENGASLKNVVIGDNGADGIHLYGDAKIDNLHVTNVGEDAITVKANKQGKKSNVEITNSTFQNASDKIIQLNADTTLNVNNVKAKDFGTFVRTNGGQQGNWELNLSHISAQNGKFSFVKSDSEGLKVNVSDIALDNVKHHYKVPASAVLKGTA